ncbi:MAG TPA: HD domain-containing protein [bacterium]|nr:HD domain-containing protein [bacterium]
MTSTEKKLLPALKALAKKELEKNERFHDYAHAISVFNNAQKLITGEKAERKVNVLAVLTATLFHDISSVDKHDSLESAKKVGRLLKQIPDFPKDTIKEVERLIASVERDHMNENALDELLVNEADSLEVFSKLSLCRGFMICGKRGWKLQSTIEDFQHLINRKYKELQKKCHSKTAKKIAKQELPFIKKFLRDCASLYILK